jgi:hypothetical protein
MRMRTVLMYLGVIENPARPTSRASALTTIVVTSLAVAMAFWLTHSLRARLGIVVVVEACAALLATMVPRLFPPIGRTDRRQ